MEMRPNCEGCGTGLPADGVAFVCSFECTFCSLCAAGGACPNCGGELVRRPTRSAALAGRYPPRVEPKVAIGHVGLRCVEPNETAAFYERLGLNRVAHGGSLEIMELKGGSHLLLFRARGKPRKGPIKSFDLMVDDLAAERALLLEQGVECSEVHKDRWSGHQMFEVTDPDGHVLSVVSGHDD